MATKVELVYIPEGSPMFHGFYAYAPGLMVGELLKISEFYKQFPELADAPFGVFSTRATPDTVLKPGDRLEIYRPLTRDPKERRRQRAKIK